MGSYRNYPTIVYENLKQMYHASADTYGEKTLFMQKEGGEYKSYSFRQYAEEVDALGTALCARGLKGKRVIVTGENGYDWVRSYMAVICGVGVVVPVDKEIPAEEIARRLQYVAQQEQFTLDADAALLPPASTKPFRCSFQTGAPVSGMFASTVSALQPVLS